jgi:hypothetical protein
MLTADKVVSQNGAGSELSTPPSRNLGTPIIAESGSPSIQLLDIRIAENQMLSEFYEKKVTPCPAHIACS